MYFHSLLLVVVKSMIPYGTSSLTFSQLILLHSSSSEKPFSISGTPQLFLFEKKEWTTHWWVS